VTILGRDVRIWAGTPSTALRGPIVVYWHATGSSPSEASWGLGQAAIDEIVRLGGIVIAPNAYDGNGGKDGSQTTGNNVWYVGDLKTADEAVACAIQQLGIDTRHIHAAGFSAGGLQTAAMTYARSGYLASVVTYSGGLSFFSTTLQDRTHPPAVAAVHGSDSDTVVLNFKTASEQFEADIEQKGGFAIDCNHGGGHTIPTGMPASTWQFMKDHPYGAKPDPYTNGIPASFPSYCKLQP
jgi:poly(3-hydroxybutyrate) depolymerase